MTGSKTNHRVRHRSRPATERGEAAANAAATEPEDPFDLPELDPNDPNGVVAELQSLPDDLPGRIRLLRRNHKEYGKEFLLHHLHLALIARTPLDQIAQQLGVSVPTVYRLRAELDERLAKQATAYDPHKLFSDTVEGLFHAKALAWRMIASAKTDADKRGALDAYLKTEAAIQATLQNYGFLDSVRITPNQHTNDDDPHVRDATDLIALAKDLLTGEWDDPEAEDAQRNPDKN